MELPVRSIRSGLDAASLSITSSPLSVVETGRLEPVVTWLIGVYVSVTVQYAAGASVVPQVVVDRNGHSLVMRRMVSVAVVELFVSVRFCFAEGWPEGTVPKLTSSPSPVRMFPVTESVPPPTPYPST